MLILFHATISTLIPIYITDLGWPKYKNKPLLKKTGLFFSFLGLVSVVLFWMVFLIEYKLEPMYKDYTPNDDLIGGSIVIVLLLIWLTYFFRKNKVSKKFKLFSTKIFWLAGFLFQGINVLMPYILAEINVPGNNTIFWQFILILAVLWFVFYQILNQKVTKRHLVNLIFGSVFFWISFSPVNEFANGIVGIVFAGLIILILLIRWRKIALKN